MIGGAVSGGAFNPARVFGPAICSLKMFKGEGMSMWLYWAGDLAGAAGAAIVQHMFSTMTRMERERMTCRDILLSCVPATLAQRCS